MSDLSETKLIVEVLGLQTKAIESVSEALKALTAAVNTLVRMQNEKLKEKPSLFKQIFG